MLQTIRPVGFRFKLITISRWARRHNLSLGANLSDKRIIFPVNLNRGEQKNNSYFGSLTTFFRIPLQTTISFNTNMTQSSALASVPLSGFPCRNYNITAISLKRTVPPLGGETAPQRDSEQFDSDVKRTLFQVGADYTITNNHALAFEYDYIVKFRLQERQRRKPDLSVQLLSLTSERRLMASSTFKKKALTWFCQVGIGLGIGILVALIRLWDPGFIQSVDHLSTDYRYQQRYERLKASGELWDARNSPMLLLSVSARTI